MTSNVDFGQAASDYATHRAGFPEAFFDRVRAFGIGFPGQRLVDLGTGTGTLARGFARRGLRTTGVDISSQLLDKVGELAARDGIEVERRLASAEETGLPDHSFDVVTAGQCWHWFDRPKAAAEAARLLVPGGLLMIAHFDWLPYAGNVAEATEELIERHNPAQWKPHIRIGQSTGIYAPWTFDVVNAGFGAVETFSFDVTMPYTHEGWRGRIRASQGVAAMLSAEAVAAFDREHEAVLKERFPQPILEIPHRVFALICRAPVLRR
ncbi:MAG TPA: class I SAM-dependent methyltransferase [Labilithrix sp.]|nr:class I SAM-dependent methyltransferase [Labilithrix sp.]